MFINPNPAVRVSYRQILIIAARAAIRPALSVTVDFFWVVRPMRWAFFVVGLWAAALLGAPQSEDILLGMYNDLVFNLPGVKGQWFWLFLALAYLSVQTWYVCRVVGEIKFRPEPRVGNPRRREAWLKWMPRILGLAVFVCAEIAFLEAGITIESTAADRWIQNSIVWSPMAVVLAVHGLTVLLAGIYILFVTKRRDWSATARRYRHFSWINAGPKAGKRQVRFPKLPATTRWLYGAMVAGTVALFFWATFDPVGAGHTFGASAIFIIAAATWIPAGTLVLVVPAELYGLPMVTLVVLLAFCFSSYNDNHQIREIAGENYASRMSVKEAVQTWKNYWDANHPDMPAHPIVVATAGGGLRAAYWTTIVLAKLRERVPDFDDRLFAISGVSGGSLGAVTYRALLNEKDVSAGQMMDRADERLGQDFLAPAFAAMLYPDLVQRLVPVGLLPDRAKAIELAWESAWPQASGFHGDFVTLANQGHPWPALFLNGTSVNGGVRLVTASLDLKEGGATYRDLLTEIRSDLHVSTAVANSARFPVVSPAGTLEFGEHKVDQIVDGGYYENNGAVTASDIIELMTESKIIPAGDIIVVQIGSEPKSEAQIAAQDSHSLERPDADVVHGEVLSPLLGLWNTRGAHGDQAVDNLARKVNGHLARVDMLDADAMNVRVTRAKRTCPDRVAPLGWVLASQTRAALRCQVNFMTTDAIALLNGVAYYRGPMKRR